MAQSQKFTSGEANIVLEVECTGRSTRRWGAAALFVITLLVFASLIIALRRGSRNPLARGMPTVASNMPKLSAAAAVGADPAKQQWVSFFKDSDKTGWDTTSGWEADWQMDKGNVRWSATVASYLVTHRNDYRDFEISGEARVSNGAYAQIVIRDEFGRSGEPHHVGYALVLNSNNDNACKTGSLLVTGTGAVRTVRASPAPPGIWFDFDIVAEGNHLIVKINNQVTADYTDPQSRYDSGHISILGGTPHGSPSMYLEMRNLKIKEAPAVKGELAAGYAALAPSPLPIGPHPVRTDDQLVGTDAAQAKSASDSKSIAQKESQKGAGAARQSSQNAVADRVEKQPQSRGTIPTPAASQNAPVREPPMSPEERATFLKLADLESFSFNFPRGRFPLQEPQRLFIPYCSRVVIEPSGYKNVTRISLSHYKELSISNDQDLRDMAEESHRIFVLRLKLNLANEGYGLTPSASTNLTRAAVWGLALNGRPPGDSRDFEDAENALRGLSRDLGRADAFTAVAKYADMEAVDQSVKLWHEHTLAWAKRAAGPRIDQMPITVEPRWGQYGVIGMPVSDFLNGVMITNTSPKTLTNAVFELTYVNEWQEREASYYFFSNLRPGMALILELHPRWVQRMAPYSRNITLHYSVWATESSTVDFNMTVHPPNPDQNAKADRKSFRQFDDEFSDSSRKLTNIFMQ